MRLRSGALYGIGGGNAAPVGRNLPQVRERTFVQWVRINQRGLDLQNVHIQQQTRYSSTFSLASTERPVDNNNPVVNIGTHMEHQYYLAAQLYYSLRYIRNRVNNDYYFNRSQYRIVLIYGNQQVFPGFYRPTSDNRLDPHLERMDYPFYVQHGQYIRNLAAAVTGNGNYETEFWDDQITNVRFCVFVNLPAGARLPIRVGSRMFYNDKQNAKAKATQMFGVNAYTNIIPVTEERLCLPMALMNCQIRTHTFSPTGNYGLESIIESGESLVIHPEDQTVIRIPIQYEHRLTPFIQNNHIIIGNTISYHPDYLPEWKRAAQTLHEYVEAEVGERVDMNELNSCCQHYANALNITFHIFNDNSHTRNDVIQPEHRQLTTRHVYFVIREEHCLPVVNIRKFICFKCNRVTGLCDYCQHIQYNNKEPSRMKHISECYRERNTIPKKMIDFTKELTNTELPYRYTQGFCVEEQLYSCHICRSALSNNETTLGHVCFANYELNSKWESLSPEDIWVYDLESMQTFDGKTWFIHKCILIVMMNVYDNSKKFSFQSMEEFVSFLDTPENNMAGKTLIAHNGGGYDVQFLIVELERRGMTYKKTPRPGSQHKFLEITMNMTACTINNDRRCTKKQGDHIRFIDSMMLIPGSLKGIAQAFKLPVSKGDFPHRFIQDNNREYIGSIPPLRSEKDYFCLDGRKSEKEIAELETWYQTQCRRYCTCELECTCTKEKWCAKDVLYEYCELDVIVLANIIQRYRDMLLTISPEETDSGWTSAPIDPITCCTQSQVAMKFFMQGWNLAPLHKKLDLYVPPQTKRYRNWKMFYWMESIELAEQITIHNYATRGDEYFFREMNMYADGWTDRDNFYFYVNSPDEYATIERKMHMMRIYRYTICCDWEYEVDETLRDQYEPYQDREIFYGGRTEVFCPFAKGPLKFIDVCSLYPSICAQEVLPIGEPEFIYRRHVDIHRLNKNNPNAYYGYAKCRVKCPNDFMGILPSRQDGKLVFDLNEKTGYWSTPEIYFAMDNGYVVEEIYQVIHFNETNRSDKYMRGYMEYWLRIKQQSEGWIALGAATNEPTEEEMDRIVEDMYVANGRMGRLDRTKVEVNPVMRQIAKIFLNCLWGKFCQELNTTQYCTVTSYQEFNFLTGNRNIDMNSLTFRDVNNSMLDVKYDKKDVQKNKKYSIFTGAMVTAMARRKLMMMGLEAGMDNIVYCDTDSWVLRWNARTQAIVLGCGLGQWTDEFPGKEITAFYALAPKFYKVVFADGSGGGDKTKGKGLWWTLANKNVMTKEMFERILLDYVYNTDNEPLELQNMVIAGNNNRTDVPYAQVYTLYNTKKVRSCFTKRYLLAEYPDNLTDPTDFYQHIECIRLYPAGFQLEENEM